MIDPKHNPLGIPEEYLAAIGSAVATWAALELFMDGCIRELANLERLPGIAMTAQMSFPAKAHVLNSLITIREASRSVTAAHAGTLKDAIAQADKLYPVRNSIVHGHWYSDDDSGTTMLTKFSARGSVKYKDQFQTVDDLHTFASETFSAASSFMNAYLSLSGKA